MKRKARKPTMGAASRSRRKRASKRKRDAARSSRDSSPAASAVETLDATEPTPDREPTDVEPLPEAVAERVVVKRPVSISRGIVDPLPPSPASRNRRMPKRRRGVAWTAYRYILGEICRVMLVGVLAISLIGTTVLAYQLARSGIRLGFLWPVLFKSLAYPLFFSIPVSLLFGITLGLGRMAAELELDAFRANGVSSWSLAIPVLFLAFLLTAFSFVLNGNIIPEIHYEKGNLRDAILNQLEDLGSGRNRSLLLPRGGRLFVESYSGSRLKGVHLEINDSISQRFSRSLRQRLRTGNGGAKSSRRGRAPDATRARPTLLAKECDLEISADRTQILLNLRGVKINLPHAATGANKRADVFRQTVSIGELKLALPFIPKGERVKDRSWFELFEYRREIDEQIVAIEKELVEARKARAASSSAEKSDLDEAVREIERDHAFLEHKAWDAQTELHRRGALSLSSLSFALVGLPIILLFGGRSRLVPFFFGNVFVVMPFFLLLMLGVKLGENGIAAPVTLAAPNVGLLVVAFALWSRVIRR